MTIHVYSKRYGHKQILVDDSDVWVQDLGLSLSKAGGMLYVRTRKDEYLHRLLMNPPKEMVVDHINRNPLDNRRSNLRICTIQENLRNQKRPNNKTGITGVALAYGGKFSAQIKHNYRKIHLGVFETIEEAARARRKAEQLYWNV